MPHPCMNSKTSRGFLVVSAYLRQILRYLGSFLYLVRA
jgi:hypothetical protein